MIAKKQSTLIISLIALAVFTTTQFTLAEKNTLLLTESEVLKALMKNQDVLLQNAKHCSGVGTNEHDETIGDYLSGFWAFHIHKDGSNWLEINVSKFSDTLLLAKVMIYRKNGEENWGWGVSFKLDGKANVKRDSFTCLGSG